MPTWMNSPRHAARPEVADAMIEADPEIYEILALFQFPITWVIGNAPAGAWLVARVWYFRITEALLFIDTYKNCIY
jgi:hypothetical protein